MGFGVHFQRQDKAAGPSQAERRGKGAVVVAIDSANSSGEPTLLLDMGRHAANHRERWPDRPVRRHERVADRGRLDELCLLLLVFGGPVAVVQPPARGIAVSFAAVHNGRAEPGRHGRRARPALHHPRRRHHHATADTGPIRPQRLLGDSEGGRR